jgi:hypothetical protein
MTTTKQVFDERQPRISISKSGRAMVALNEQVVTTREAVPVGMDDDGVMRQEEHEKTQYAYDVCWIDDVSSEKAVLVRAKETVLADIVRYDTSSAVNGFMLNGQKVWLDKATRVGLMNSTTIAKTMGQATTTLWLGEAKLVVDCDKAIQLLSALEMYALECFNVTAAHNKAVTEMTTLENVLGYDYTCGYPQKLTMEV